MKEVTEPPKEPKEKRLAESAAEKYKKALEHAESIKQSAVDELKNGINAQIAELNAFGFDYRLAEAGSKPTAAKKRTASAKEKFCEICKMAGHDKRNHRHQEPVKKFTKAELEERGLPAA